MVSIKHTLHVLAGLAPMAASLLGGCASPSMTGEATPPSHAAVSATPAGGSSTAPTNEVGTYDKQVVTYPEGRFQLYGNSTTGYYWVWIPTGAGAPITPAPPALPVVNPSPAPPVVVVPGPSAVAAAPSGVAVPVQNQVVYPEGRYQLYGDATRGYYWVWIPAGVAVPYAPPQPRLGRTPSQ